MLRVSHLVVFVRWTKCGSQREKALLQILVWRWIVRFANVPFERWILKLNI
jgi:hypothetical protein